MVGSPYGRPRARVWVRLAAPTKSWKIKNHDQGPAWTEMKITAARIMDLEREVMVPVGQTVEHRDEEQEGEVSYASELPVPTGDLQIQFKVHADLPGAEPYAFPGWNLKAQRPASP